MAELNLEEKLKRAFDNLVKIVFGVILMLIMLGIMIGVGKLVVQIYVVLKGPGVTEEYYRIISDVLTLFVLVELSRSLVEFFDVNRLRLTYIIDGGIVFVLREVMINLFQHRLTAVEIVALSFLLLVLGGIRIASVLVFQRETRLMADLGGRKAQ